MRVTLIVFVVILFLSGCTVKPRNWHYYYREGDVIDGIRPFYYIPKETYGGSVPWHPDQPRGLGNLAPTRDSGRWYTRHPSANMNLPPMRLAGPPGLVTGLDTVAITMLHENQHVTNFNTNRHLITAWINAGRPGGFAHPDSDEDEDGITRSNEIAFGLDPKWPDTYDMEGAFGYRPYHDYGDDEFICRVVEGTGVRPTVHPERNWGYPGRNKGVTPW